MKINGFTKKLILNKRTVANLNNTDMNSLKGGIYTGYTCQDDGCDTVISCENTLCYICESITCGTAIPPTAFCTNDCNTNAYCTDTICRPTCTMEC